MRTIARTLRKIWTWRRDRAARRLRTRLFLTRNFDSIARDPENFTAMLDYIMDAPLRQWALREKCYRSPGGKLKKDQARRMTDIRLAWIRRGEGLEEYRKELESLLRLQYPTLRDVR